MKKNKKLKIIGFALFSFLSIGTLASCSIYDKIKDIITGTNNGAIEDTGEEFIKGSSFLNYDAVRGLKETEYTLTASVTPANHTAPVVWTSDFPDYVSVIAGENDTATIIRHEDYRGYVKITASIDGISATCKVSCVDDIQYVNFTVDDETEVKTFNGSYYYYTGLAAQYSELNAGLYLRTTLSSCTNIANDGSNYIESVKTPSFLKLNTNITNAPSFMTINANSETYITYDEASDLFRFCVTCTLSPTSDFNWNPWGISSVNIKFIEYVVATNITLDKNSITI